MSYKSVSRNIEVHTTLSADHIAYREQLKVPLTHQKHVVAQLNRGELCTEVKFLGLRFVQILNCGFGQY